MAQAHDIQAIICADEPYLKALSRQKPFDANINDSTEKSYAIRVRNLRRTVATQPMKHKRPLQQATVVYSRTEIGQAIAKAITQTIYPG